MDRKRILFLGDPASIHDVKWMKYFTELRGDYGVFVTEQPVLEEHRERLLKIGIKEVHQIPMFSLLNLLKNYKTFCFLKGLIKKHQLENLHVYIGTSHVIIASMLRVNRILTTRGTDVLITLTGLNKSRSLKDKALFWLLKRSYSRFDTIVSTSVAMVERIHQLIPNLIGKVQNIRTGVDIVSVSKALDETPYEIPHAKSVILFPRGIKDVYNPLLLAHAATNCSPETKMKHVFVFLKAGYFDEKLWNETERILKQDTNVSYCLVDYLSQEQMWSANKTAKLVVMVPKSDGTPNSGLESMGAKTPLIMGGCDYDEQLFNDQTNWFCKSGDPTDLAKMIDSALNNYPNELLEYAYENALKHADWSGEMEKVLKLYV